MTEVINPIFQIFRPSFVVDTSTTEWEYVEYREASNNLSTATNFRLFTTDLDAFFYPSDTVVQIQVNCRKVNGGDGVLSAGAAMALVNDGFNLFSQARLYFDNLEISNLPLPGKTHLIRSLIDYSKDYAKTVGKSLFFYPDSVTDGHDATTVRGKIVHTNNADEVVGNGFYNKLPAITYSGGNNTVTVSDTNNWGSHKLALVKYNVGFKKRVDLCKGVINLTLPLSELFPILKDYNRIMRGVKLELQLTKNTTYQDVFFGDNTSVQTDPIFNIEYLSLWIPRLKPSIGTLAAIEKDLTSGQKQIVMYNHHELHTSPTFVGTAGSQSQSWRVSSEMSRPRQIIVAFQYSDRMTSYELNSCQFDHIDLTSIELRLNGKVYPRESYQFTSTNYVRAVNELHRLGRKLGDYEDSSLIDFENWRSIYPLIVFNVEYQEEGLFSASTRSEIELRWTAGPTNAANYVGQCLITTERVLEFDSINGQMQFTKK